MVNKNMKMNRERVDDLKATLLNRMRSINGHVSGITKMVDEDKYCIDIIHQIQAVQSALNKVSLMLLEDHMNHCVTHALRSGDVDEGQRVIAELKDVFDTLSKI